MLFRSLDVTAIEATRIAESSELGDFRDWRLPTEDELVTAIRSGKLRSNGVTVRGSQDIWSQSRRHGLARCVNARSGLVTEFPTYRSVGRVLIVRTVLE